MFIGHFGLGFAGKSRQPAASLGTYFLAAQFLDLLWPSFLLLGIEKAEINPASSTLPLSFTYYPYSHSLLAAVVWSILFGSVYYIFKKNKSAALLLGLLVFSHWLLDFLVHVPDLPLYPGSDQFFGLGLWQHKIVELVIELLLFAGCIIWYASVTTPKNKTGTWAFISLIVFLLIIHLANMFGPPPPDMSAVAWASQLQWLIVLWGYWVDSKRKFKAQIA